MSIGFRFPNSRRCVASLGQITICANVKGKHIPRVRSCRLRGEVVLDVPSYRPFGEDLMEKLGSTVRTQEPRTAARVHKRDAGTRSSIHTPRSLTLFVLSPAAFSHGPPIDVAGKSQPLGPACIRCCRADMIDMSCCCDNMQKSSQCQGNIPRLQKIVVKSILAVLTLNQRWR